MSSITEESVRNEVKQWLAENWSPNLPLQTWRDLVVDSGWGCPTWPLEWYGRGLANQFTDAVDEEFCNLKAPGIASAGARMLAAATLLEHGTDDHKKKLLRGLITGEDTWCQLFSEPGSGSDLAGLTTKAEFDGENWIINGQKVWTTSAHHADYGLLLARTDWDQPKHRGLSYFVIDMKQPGIEVRQLRQMNGHASFNEVFITNAKIAPEYLLEGLGDGWKVALTTLAHERRLAGNTSSWGNVLSGEGSIYAELRAEADIAMAPYTWYPQRAGRVDLLLERAEETGQISDAITRQAIAKTLTAERCSTWMLRRAKAAQALGRKPGAEGSLSKLAGSYVSRSAAHAHTLITGTQTMLNGEDSPREGLIAEIFVSTPAASIAGGTDEIQRNIISERVLGLPKEPRTDVDRPFRDVPRNAAKTS